MIELDADLAPTPRPHGKWRCVIITDFNRMRPLEVIVFHIIHSSLTHALCSFVLQGPDPLDRIIQQGYIDRWEEDSCLAQGGVESSPEQMGSDAEERRGLLYRQYTAMNDKPLSDPPP